MSLYYVIFNRTRVPRWRRAAIVPRDIDTDGRDNTAFKYRYTRLDPAGIDIGALDGLGGSVSVIGDLIQQVREGSYQKRGYGGPCASSFFTEPWADTLGDGLKALTHGVIFFTLCCFMLIGIGSVPFATG